MVFNAMHFQHYFSYIMTVDMQWNLFNTARLSIDKSLICLFIQNIDLNLTSGCGRVVQGAGCKAKRMYQCCGFKSRRGKNKNLTALKSNSDTVWFNFQTYIIFSINLVSLVTLRSSGTDMLYGCHLLLDVYIYIYIYFLNSISKYII